MDGKLIPAQPWAVDVQVLSIFGTCEEVHHVMRAQTDLLLAALEGSRFIFEECQSLSITPAQYKAYIEDVYSIAAPLVEKAYPISAFNSAPYPVQSFQQRLASSWVQHTRQSSHLCLET